MHLGTRSLTISIGGVSRTGDVTECRIVSAPLDAADRVIGGPWREYRLQGTAAQDPTPGSLWELAWDPPWDAVRIDLRPAGGTVVSELQPAFLGYVIVDEPDGDLLGGQANVSRGSRFTFAIDWAFTEKPVRVTTPSEYEELTRTW